MVVFILLLCKGKYQWMTDLLFDWSGEPVNCDVIDAKTAAWSKWLMFRFGSKVTCQLLLLLLLWPFHQWTKKLLKRFIHRCKQTKCIWWTREKEGTSVEDLVWVWVGEREREGFTLREWERGCLCENGRESLFSVVLFGNWWHFFDGASSFCCPMVSINYLLKN